jgi:cell division septation protein DedD
VDARVKERLTGAIILVALLVLLVPELLTGPSAKSVAQPPGEEGGALRSYTIDLADDPAANRSAGASGPAPAPGTSVSDEPPVAQANIDAAETAAGDEANGAGASADPDAGVVAEPPSASADDTAATSSDLGVAHGSSADPVAAARPAPAATRVEPPKPAVVETPRPTSSKGWSVQLGAFGSRENAERLVKQVKGKGFPAAINENGSSKLRYRVRVGSERDRAGADALAARLRASGHKDATVVPPG